MNDGFVDPYLWPGETVLRNRLGLHSHSELAEAEYELTLQRRIELEDFPIRGNFDLDHLRAVHRHLFQDIFDWAGEIRTVVIHKGSSTFHTPDRIDMAAEYTFGKLRDGPLLSSNVDDVIFVDEATELLDDVNYMHPFREGNGRAQRAFLDQVARVSGRVLTWRNVSAAEGNTAAEEAVAEGKPAKLRQFLARVTLPPLEGAPGFDLDAYRVQPPTSVSVGGGKTDRCRRCGRPLNSAKALARGYGKTCWERRYD